MTSPRRVVVTGLGIVCPLGLRASPVWKRLLAGRCGVSRLKGDEFEKLGLGSQVAAAVPRGDGEGHFRVKDWVPKSALGNTAPFAHFAISAASQALEDAKWGEFAADGGGLTRQQQCATGVAIGAGMSSTEDLYDAGKVLHDRGVRRVSPYVITKILGNLAAGQVSIQHKLKGPNHAVATACATGAHAIGDAYRFIKYGDADVMVAGGTEAALTPIGMTVFSRIRALSTAYNDNPELASRPFDAGRDGFVMGEGSGVIVLEEYEHAKRRGAHMYAEVTGYGLSGDAHHITAPSEDGDGAQRCMEAALRSAGLLPSDIDYINAHATSTPIGDDIELRAIRRLFTQTGPRNSELSVSSTKGAVGHTLGAAGAIEALFTILALQDDVVPPTLNLGEVNPEFASFPGVDLTPGQAVRRPIRHALTNSFGFGGTNASLIFSKID